MTSGPTIFGTPANDHCLTVKAYIRKSQVLFTMRDYIKAIEAVQEAAEHDEANAHSKEIQEQIWKCQQAQFAQREGESDDDVMQRAMRDPEVAVSTLPRFSPSLVTRVDDFPV